MQKSKDSAGVTLPDPPLDVTRTMGAKSRHSRSTLSTAKNDRNFMLSQACCSRNRALGAISSSEWTIGLKKASELASTGRMKSRSER